MIFKRDEFQRHTHGESKGYIIGGYDSCSGDSGGALWTTHDDHPVQIGDTVYTQFSNKQLREKFTA